MSMSKETAPAPSPESGNGTPVNLNGNALRERAHVVVTESAHNRPLHLLTAQAVRDDVEALLEQNAALVAALRALLDAQANGRVAMPDDVDRQARAALALAESR